jgi:RES domain-containing protein
LNPSRCNQLTGTNLVGTWYRAVDPRFLATAITTVHTAKVTSRFSPATPQNPGFEILYLAENPLVTLFEAQALFGSPTSPGGIVPHPARPLVTLPIAVNLTDVPDLTDPQQSLLVETNAQELTGDWRSFLNRPAPSPHGGLAPTQQLGHELYRLGTFKALLSFSAKLPDYKILAIFPHRVRNSGCSVSYTYRDAQGNLQTILI